MDFGKFLASTQISNETTRIFNLDMLAIDEVSMMTKKDWRKLDKLLCRYRKIGGIPFGGVNIILVGDFLQLPPVGSDPIFIDPSSKRTPSVTDCEGFDLWRQVNRVIILEECMRFQSDPEWGDGCRNARLGTWTTEFIGLINSRLVDERVHFEAADRGETVFVTPENTTRLSVNNSFMFKTAEMLPAHQFPVRVVADFRKSLDYLSFGEIQTIMSLPDNRFGRLAPFLDLVVGMPIQVTQNIATTKGVANGTLGTLESIHFPPSTKFRLIRDSQSKMVIQLPSIPPDFAFIRVPRSDTAVPVRHDISPKLFPVFFNTEAFNDSQIGLPPAPNGQRRRVSVKIRQFPFVCAAGSTIYKVQGETLKAMVVVDRKSEVAFVNKPQQIYLMVSRVTSRRAFMTLRPVTEEIVSWAKPPAAALNEEYRLMGLSDQTIAEWQTSRV